MILDKNKTYLITGGAGFLGQELIAIFGQQDVPTL